MCGIFAALDAYPCIISKEKLKLHYNKLKHRGPDNSEWTLINESVVFGFHRLAIVDPTPKSNQPLTLDNTWLICNGEIFNHVKLAEKYNLTENLNTGSDCEIILHLYKLWGKGSRAVKRICKELEAEFAFVLYDDDTKECFSARDPYGVRPLFWGYDEMLPVGVFFSSELKSLGFLSGEGIKVQPFLPGYWMKFNMEENDSDFNYKFHIKKYYEFPKGKIYPKPARETALRNIKSILRDAVSKRLMSDRPVGVCTSGGLDSSLITSLVSEHLPNVECFSVGFENGVDIQYAKKVIQFLQDKGRNVKHHIINFTVQEAFESIKDIIYHLESFDITTIRAGIGNYFLAKYVKENTDITVLYSGSGIDEWANGYQYGKMIKDTDTLQNDAKRLLRELYLFDNLRDDRCTAAFSLELRVPMLDPQLVDYVLSLPTEWRFSYDQEMEKLLIRDAFRDDDILPLEILYRRKEAWSNGNDNGVLCLEKELQKLIEPLVSDEELKQAHDKYPHVTPTSKESYYYRQIFEELFPDRSHVIPHYWIPPENIMGKKIIDPSAKILDCYKS